MIMANPRLVLLAYCTDNLTELVREAEDKGLPVEVLVKDDELFDIIKRHDARYLVGVCCPAKIESVTPHLDKRGIQYRAIPTEDGSRCFKLSQKKRRVDMQAYTEALDWLKQQ